MLNTINAPTVSVVMPIFNESRYIAKCIDSLLLQDHPKEDMEWIFVDGRSTDDTRAIVGTYIEKYPELIQLLDNPKKTAPCAMNVGISASRGKYIIRLDAHADYDHDYISKCVYHLDHSDADNVGGTIETKAKTPMGERIACMLSSKFGVGNSGFRTNGEEGYVDTVPFGAFRREVFYKYGMYDERLTRNQDNEMNFRIRKNGGKIYMSHDIKCTYYCRDTIGAIGKQAFNNGKWNVVTMRVAPGSMGVRHFIPFVFLISLIVMPILSILWYPFALLFAAELTLYAILDIVFSVKEAISRDSDVIATALWLPVLFPMYHLCYGYGSFVGITTLFGRKFKRDMLDAPAQNKQEINKETPTETKVG